MSTYKVRIARSSKTGRFVSKLWAKRHPATTTVETQRREYTTPAPEPPPKTPAFEVRPKPPLEAANVWCATREQAEAVIVDAMVATSTTRDDWEIVEV